MQIPKEKKTILGHLYLPRCGKYEMTATKKLPNKVKNEIQGVP